MSVYKSLVLGIFFALIVSYIYFVELPGQERRVKQELVLGGISAGEISRIEVQNKSGSYSLINKENSENLSAWSLADLEKASLDKGALNALLTALIQFKADPDIQPIKENLDGPVFGFESPEVSLKVVKNGEEIEIKLGNKNEYLQKRYARASNSEYIFLVEDDLFQAGIRSRDALRSKAPLAFATAELDSFSIESASAAPLFFEVDENWEWHIKEGNSPTAYRASDAEVSSLLNELRSFRADEFIDDLNENKASYRLEEPAVTVTLNFKEVLAREPLKVLVSPPDEQSDNVVFTTSQYPYGYMMSKNPLPILLGSLRDFREKQLFKFASDLAIKAEFSGAALSEELLLEQEEGNWTVNGQEGDAIFIRQLLENYSRLEAEDFTAFDRDDGFDEPAIKASITLRDGTEMTLLIGKPVSTGDDEKGYYVKRKSDPEVYTISKNSYRRLVPRQEALVMLEEDGSVPNM